MVSTLTPAEAGVHRGDDDKLGMLIGFQRSPRPKPGCIGAARGAAGAVGVSTLTPAEAGVHRRRCRPGRSRSGFNAHPGRSRGASVK